MLSAYIWILLNYILKSILIYMSLTILKPSAWNEDLGKWRSLVICTGSTVFHWYFKSSVVHPSEQLSIIKHLLIIKFISFISNIFECSLQPSELIGSKLWIAKHFKIFTRPPLGREGENVNLNQRGNKISPLCPLNGHCSYLFAFAQNCWDRV